jgi:hypothetical protein
VLRLVRRPECCLTSLVRVRDAAEGDLETEGAQLADVVGDLPAEVMLAFVVVRAEVAVRMPGLDSSLW